MHTEATPYGLTRWRIKHWKPRAQPRTHAHWLTDEAGLSMMEIVVGVQLFAILALVSAMNFSQVLQVYYLRGATREVYADLQKARMAAVMENHRYDFSVVDGHTYKIHDDANNNGAEDPEETVMTRDLRTDSPRVQLAGTNTITFAANGAAPTYGSIRLSNETDPTRTVTVVVGPAGRVRIN